MSVFKRGKYYYTKFQSKGQKVYESTKCVRKADAEAYEANLKRGLKPKRGYTVNDVALIWIDDGAPESMDSHLKAVLIHMADALLVDAPKAADDMRRKMLKKGLSPQTVNRRLATVRTILNRAYKVYSMINEPLGMKISPLMTSEKEFERQIFLTIEQVREILKHVKNEEAKKFFLVLCSTGMRFSELLNLRPEQYSNGMIRLDAKTKSKRGRSVPVPDWAKYAVADLPMKITKSIARGEFERARKAAGMTHVRMHDLRHTFASWLAQNPDVPFAVIRDILGHSSSKVTDKYTHLRSEALVKASDTLIEI